MVPIKQTDKWACWGLFAPLVEVIGAAQGNNEYGDRK